MPKQGANLILAPSFQYSYTKPPFKKNGGDSFLLYRFTYLSMLFTSIHVFQGLSELQVTYLQSFHHSYTMIKN